MSSNYDNPMRVSYNFGIHDFGAGSDALAIAVPTGYGRAAIELIAVSATEAFNSVTTEAFVRLGTAADNDRYAELAIGDLANTNAVAVSNKEALGDTQLKDIGQGGKGIVDIITEAISQIELNLVAPVGGTPAGQGYVTVVIGWY